MLRSFAIASLAANAAAQYTTSISYGTSGVCTGTELDIYTVAFSTACTKFGSTWEAYSCTLTGFELSTFSAAGCAASSQIGQPITISKSGCSNGVKNYCTATGNIPTPSGPGINQVYFSGTSCSGTPTSSSSMALNQCIPSTPGNPNPKSYRYTCSGSKIIGTTWTNNACTGTGTPDTVPPVGCMAAGSGQMIQISHNGCSSSSGAESYATAAGVVAAGVAAVAALM